MTKITQYCLATLLGAIVSSSYGLEMGRYLPLNPGNQWSFRNAGGATQTISVSSPAIVPSGVLATPLKSIRSNSSGSTQRFFTNDDQGLRLHQETVGNLYVTGVGYLTASMTLSPPALFAPANPTIGGNYTSAGAAEMNIAGLGSFSLSYSSTTQVIGFELVSDYNKTQSWLAAKVSQSLTISGTINGLFFSDSSTETDWLVDGIGIVKGMASNTSGVMETWQLTSTNVWPPVPANPLLHPLVFDPVFYIKANPELQQPLSWNPEAAKDHWINSGIREGRIASSAFSVNWYKYANGGLATLGDNNESYVRHYAQWGMAEGRESAANFSARDYLRLNSDLATAFGTDYSAVTAHYVNNGVREGRRSSQYFDPKKYLANNRGLATSFGTDYTAATIHYILYGIAEGRMVDPTYPVAPKSLVLPPVPTNPADCLFNWAEKTYPTLFAPAAASNTFTPYYYRHYSQTDAELRVSSADNRVYYVGPLSSNAALDLGALSTWLTTAGCQ